MNTDVQVLILAAGKGSRMGGELPKALTLLDGKPMVHHLLESIKKFSQIKPITVIGYKGDMVKESLAGASIYALQEEQKGTGHAVMSAREQLLESPCPYVAILNADQPLISENTLNQFSNILNKGSKFVIATSNIADDNLFENYFKFLGRIDRNESGTIRRIIESKDANQKELEIREISPAFFCLEKKWLLEKLDFIGNNNTQGEYYITDLISLAFNEGITIESVQVSELEALGANSLDQLELLESYL